MTSASGRSSRSSGARIASTNAAPTAITLSACAARSATRGGSSPAGNTRLPPDQRVGVRLARSASRSKKSFA